MDVFGYTITDLTANTVTQVYTVPVRATLASSIVSSKPSAVDVNTQAQITSILVCNYDSGNARVYSLYLTPLSGTSSPDSDAFTLVSLDSIAASTTRVLSLGLVLAAGNTLHVKATTADTLIVTVNHIEVS